MSTLWLVGSLLIGSSMMIMPYEIAGLGIWLICSISQNKKLSKLRFSTACITAILPTLILFSAGTYCLTKSF